jgi:hypothetical protein
MKTVLVWLQHNKEWVFSGVGIPIATGVLFMVRAMFRKASTQTPALPQSRIPALSVDFAFGHLTYEGPPYLGDQMLLFTVSNPSDRSAQLTSICLPLKDRTKMVFPHLEGEKRLPCMIEPSTSCKFWVDLSDVEASIRSRGCSGPLELHAVASDALGNDYTSNTVTL